MKKKADMDHTFRPAVPGDTDAVFALFEKRIRWMDEKGIRHWNTQNYTEKYPKSHFAEQQRLGNLYVLENRMRKIIGAVVLYRSDPRWQGFTDPAFYIHHLVTDPIAGGAGEEMMRLAEQTAREKGIGILRLDCAESNDFLNRYYRQLGFIPAGTCRDGSYIGCRYEKRI